MALSVEARLAALEAALAEVASHPALAPASVPGRVMQSAYKRVTAPADRSEPPPGYMLSRSFDDLFVPCTADGKAIGGARPRAEAIATCVEHARKYPAPQSPRCTCGSGAHPRRCELHPDAYDRHVAELNRANDEDNARPEPAAEAGERGNVSDEELGLELALAVEDRVLYSRDYSRCLSPDRRRCLEVAARALYERGLADARRAGGDEP